MQFAQLGLSRNPKEWPGDGGVQALMAMPFLYTGATPVETPLQSKP